MKNLQHDGGDDDAICKCCHRVGIVIYFLELEQRTYIKGFIMTFSVIMKKK